MDILVVDDVRLTAEVIATTLKRELTVRSVRIARGMDEACKHLATQCADIVLINGTLADGAALPLTCYVTEASSVARVLIYALEDLDAMVPLFCEAGAVGYLSSEDTAAALTQRVLDVANGEAFMSPRLIRILMTRMAELTSMLDDQDMDLDAYDTLTDREREILHLLAKGLTNQEIGTHLEVAMGTVKNHVHNLLGKLGLSSRRDAATYLSLVGGDIPSGAVRVEQCRYDEPL